MARQFYTLDVFTNRVFGGNPLGVVLDAQGLDTDEMQRIAAEFNLSETAFVLPAENPDNRAKVRIFTPVHELPFAGHPTVGTAVLLAKLDGIKDGGSFVLEEGVGPVVCSISETKELLSARFELPKLPTPFEWQIASETVADALGLHPSDIGFGNHALAGWHAGVPYSLVPVRSLEAIRRIKVDPQKAMACEPVIDGIPGNLYVYCSGGEEDGDFHARMFAHSGGIPEDPATGSAVATLCGQIAALEMENTENGSFVIEQGFEMGRPSRILLDVDRRDGHIISASISGSAVSVSEGKLHY